MSTETDFLYCYFHPNRVALERCEVCDKPLCAYCLYYTEDGQRLCAEHAAEARELGVRVDEPALYAEQLLSAQLDAGHKQKREWQEADSALYKGNTTDLTALIALVLGVVTLGSCCGGFYCVPLVGLVLSIFGLLNAHKAYDPGRTRRLSALGLVGSGAVVVVIVLIFALYGVLFAAMFRSVRYWPTWAAFTATPSPTATPGTPPPPSATPKPLPTLER